MNSETLKAGADAGMIAAAIGVLMGALPALAALLTVLWLAARLYNEIMTGVYRARDYRARQPAISNIPGPTEEPTE